ncbi:MAG: hypothetical protein ACP5D9_09600, partial [Mariniphaga sp.]
LKRWNMFMAREVVISYLSEAKELLNLICKKLLLSGFFDNNNFILLPWSKNSESLISDSNYK